MATHRRGLSPTSPRVILEGPRASTGTMLTSTYDNRYDTVRPVRASFSTAPPSNHGRNNSVYETQPVSKRTYVDGSGTVSRTEYTVRERRDSAAADSRRPLTVLTKNASPTRDAYTESPRDLVAYKPHTKDETPSRLLHPTQTRGSAHHQRHNSATKAETGRHFGNAPPAPRVERAYQNRGPYVEKVADSRPNVPRYIEEPIVEYTGPREQFDRDFPVKARRESLSRRERPGSAFEARNEPFRRETAPSSASRQLARVERDERKSGFESDPDRSRQPQRARRSSRGAVVHQRDEGYSSARDDHDSRRVQNKTAIADDIVPEGGRSHYRDVNRDAEREIERTRERDRPRRVERDEEVPSDRDRDKERRERRTERPREREHERDRDRDRDRDRERDRPYHKDYEVVEEDEPRRRHRRKDTRDGRDGRDSREPSPDHKGLKALATAAVGGLAAVGIANRKSGKDEDQSDSDGKRERRHRRRKVRDSREEDAPNGEDEEVRRHRKENRSRREARGDSSGSDTPEDESTRKRPRSRSRSRTRQRQDTRDDHGSDRERPQLALPAPEMERKPSRDSETNVSRDTPSPSKAPDHGQESPVNNEGRTMSPGEGDDGRPRRVSIVEPGRDKRDDVKPRGILKKPREVPFPEDPNPQREGVAPLKQAGKEGIPPGARWTKVSRILVNPEALEKAHLRFEEREDYVIVLKVLSREEIEKLAEKTREIREHREREWRKQAANTTPADHETRSEGDYEEHRREPLAIEAPPAGPPVDLRQLAAQNNVPQQPQHAYAPPQQHQQAYPPQQQYQQPYPPQQYAPPQSWQNHDSTRSSAEAIAAAAPGQPLPSHHQQHSFPPQFDTGTYSQNV